MGNNVAASNETAHGIGVFLCGDLAKLGAGFNLQALQASLQDVFPSAIVEVIPGLCTHLDRLLPAALRANVARAVLGLCSADYSEVDLQSAARRAGLDPVGLEVLPLGTWCGRVHAGDEAVQKAKRLVVSAIARAYAFQGSDPENLKPCFLSLGEKVTRRSLFKLPPILYRAVPTIDRKQCAAGTGCRLCVAACSRDALSEVDGFIWLDKTKCESCGACVTNCPRSAIDLPGWSVSQFAAQLNALLHSVASDQQPMGLLLTCHKALATLDRLAYQGVQYSCHWFPVVMPCIGMVTPSWILQLLAQGADTVAILSCGADCSFGHAKIIGGRVNFCRRLLSLLRHQPDRVKAFTVSQPAKLLALLEKPPAEATANDFKKREQAGLCLDQLEGVLKAVQFLAREESCASNLVLEHRFSPFGLVELRDDFCTGCLLCKDACPTGALAVERHGAKAALIYSAALCTGCGVCVDTCPEKTSNALSVRTIIDMQRLALGKTVLYEKQVLTCEICGADIGSESLLKRLETSIGNEALLTSLSRYCPSCRLWKQNILST